MLYALKLAQDPSKVVTDKLMHFSPFCQSFTQGYIEKKAQKM